jgi:hypothetical protein
MLDSFWFAAFFAEVIFFNIYEVSVPLQFHGVASA